MAVTTTIIDQPRIPGARRQVVAEVLLDSSYLEGGEPLTAAELGLKRVVWGHCHIINGSESEAVEVGWARYNASKELIEVFNYKSQKAIASGKDLSKCNVLVVAYGY